MNTINLQASSRKRRTDQILAKVTFGLNVCLLIAKVIAAYLSNSLSVISTVIDSAVDITSGLVIWLTVYAVEHRDPYEYPRGRDRLEPIAVIIVSIIMGVANLVMIIQSVQSIIANTVSSHTRRLRTDSRCFPRKVLNQINTKLSFLNF